MYKNAGRSESGKELFHVERFPGSLDENTLDIDLKKEQAESAAKGAGSHSRAAEADAGAAGQGRRKKPTPSKSLNEKLNAAKTAADAGDFDTAIASLTEATQVDATRDLLWFKLGDYYRLSAAKQTDPAEKQKRLGFGRRGLSEGDRH